MTKTPILSVKNVSYHAEQFDQDNIILHDISLDLFPNEITTIIGPNGAGKSTLIKIILDLLKPTSGEVFKKKGVTLGYVPQKIRINPYLPLTVQDFLSLQGAYDVKLLETLQVTKLLKKSLHVLSGGEWQRILFARTLMNNPQILILDEPTQGVDITGQHDFFNLMLSFKEKLKFSVLLVSHDLHLVLSSTDHVICLNKHICCSGHPTDITKNEQYQLLFGKTPYQLIPYKHKHDHCHDDVCHHDSHGKN